MDPKALNALVHDREAAFYDDRFLIAHGPRLGEELTRELRATAGRLPRAGRLLDVACGTGFAALGAAWAELATEIHACDLSPRMLERTAAHAKSGELRIELSAADAERLPYADGVFDVVLARGALHHVPDPVAMLAECNRVLAPGGRVVCLAEPTPEGERQVGAVVGAAWRALSVARRVSGRSPSAEEEERRTWELASMAANLHTFTPDDLAAIAGKAGFGEITVGSASWAWVLTLGLNYFFAGEFEGMWRLPPVRAFARAGLTAASAFDRSPLGRLVPSNRHATVWAVLR